MSGAYSTHGSDKKVYNGLVGMNWEN